MKSIREIAIDVVDSVFKRGILLSSHRNALTGAIEQALRDRDERAAKIIEDHRSQDVCHDNCWTTIKAAIRKGD